MDTFAEKFLLLGLTEEQRAALSCLATLSSAKASHRLPLEVETVIIKNGRRTTINREETIAELVRTTD